MSSAGWPRRGSRPRNPTSRGCVVNRAKSSCSPGKCSSTSLVSSATPPCLTSSPGKSFPASWPIIPRIVQLRIWIAGCSSGEEAYSLAMLFREQIDKSRRGLKLQIFASDIDPDAIATAREGLYPPSIEAEVSPERLGGFFTRGDRGYRISSDLRASIVFSVHDVLADPPFARLDFISCRNLMIYLCPRPRPKSFPCFISRCRKAASSWLELPRRSGPAKRGSWSSPGRPVSIVARGPIGPVNLARRFAWAMTPACTPLAGHIAVASRQATLSDVCRSMVLGAYGPAAVLITPKLECLYFQGPNRSISQGRVGPASRI